MSTLNVSNITDGTTTVGTGYVVNGSAKAFLKVDQRSTQAILSSFNVSSITDDGTGFTSMAFSSAMANANYSLSGGTDYSVTPYFQFQFQDTATTSCKVINSQDVSRLITDGVVTCAIHGDLA